MRKRKAEEGSWRRRLNLLYNDEMPLVRQMFERAEEKTGVERSKVGGVIECWMVIWMSTVFFLFRLPMHFFFWSAVGWCSQDLQRRNFCAIWLVIAAPSIPYAAVFSFWISFFRRGISGVRELVDDQNRQNWPKGAHTALANVSFKLICCGIRLFLIHIFRYWCVFGALSCLDWFPLQIANGFNIYWLLKTIVLLYVSDPDTFATEQIFDRYVSYLHKCIRNTQQQSLNNFAFSWVVVLRLCPLRKKCSKCWMNELNDDPIE